MLGMDDLLYLSDYDSDLEDEKSLSLHYSDTEEECPSPKIPKIVLSEAEKRHERNIQEREKLWEQQEDEYENMFNPFMPGGL